jgi:hypothetical protein
VHDFNDTELAKAIPYGVYDIGSDVGWVQVGIDYDTAQFAVNSIRSWWQHLGKARYPDTPTLTIAADCASSHGNRIRLWKVELQRLANETGLDIQVLHFPPGTSKWTNIELRLFSFINLIASTTTRTGLKVYARLDDQTFPEDQHLRGRAEGRQPSRPRVPPRVELHHGASAFSRVTPRSADERMYRDLSTPDPGAGWHDRAPRRRPAGDARRPA